MNEYFVPYEQAIILKNLGFDEKCFAYYAKHMKFKLLFFENANAFWCRNSYSKSFSHIFARKENLVNCTAPTYEQAFDWLELKLNVCSYIAYNTFEDKKWCFNIYSIKDQEKLIGEGRKEGYETKQEAKVECLKQIMLMFYVDENIQSYPELQKYKTTT